MKKQCVHHWLKPLGEMLGTGVLLITTLTGCTGSSIAEGQEKTDEMSGPTSASATPLNAVRVQVSPARISTFEGRVTLTGLAKPRKTATVAAEVPGRIVKNRCALGRRVKKNDLIYQVDTSDIHLQLRQATETLDARRIDAEFSAREFARAEELVRGDVRPEQALTKSRYDRDRTRHNVEAAETALSLAQKALRDATIRAPFPGTIARCLAEKGDYVGQGTPVLNIVDLSEVRLEAGVPVALAARLRLNTHAKAEFEALGGATRDALLTETAPSPNPRSGTYPARFTVRNQDGEVLEGMTARITLDGEPREVLSVPRTAVFRVDGDPRVFTVRENRAIERSVLLGASEDDRVEIVSGVEEGERVVTDGMFALTNGRPVTVEQDEEE